MIRDFGHGEIKLRRGDLVYAVDPGRVGLKTKGIFRVISHVALSNNTWGLHETKRKNGGSFAPLPEFISPGDMVFCIRSDITFIERDAAFRSGDLVKHAEHGRGVVCKIDFGCTPEQDVVLAEFAGVKRAVLAGEVSAVGPADTLPPPLPELIEVDLEPRKKHSLTLYEQEEYY